MGQLIDESVKFPKEINDIRVALVGLVEDIKAGKDIMVIAAENLKALSEAVSGLENIGEEFSVHTSEASQCIGLMSGEIAGILLKSVPVPTPAVVEGQSA